MEENTDFQGEGRNDLYISPVTYSSISTIPTDYKKLEIFDTNDDNVDFYSNPLDPAMKHYDFGVFKNDMDESFKTELELSTTKTKIATVTAVTFTAGIISYFLRASTLFASLVSSVPLWRGFDPIAIFSGDQKKKKEHTPESDETKTETLFDGKDK